MQQITSAQFKAAVELDPAWASKLAKPMEIRDFCGMPESNITHLSPLLHFSGENEAGWCASFSDCKSLKVAEGKFKGAVDFWGSGIERIKDLTCGKNKNGVSAHFIKCESLKIAQGKFEGSVSFWNSGVETIGDLSCERDNQGIRLYVKDCPNLTKIPITFNPKEVEAGPKLIEKLEVDRFIQKKRAEIVEIEL